jgi:hypothetical protein
MRTCLAIITVFCVASAAGAQVVALPGARPASASPTQPKTVKLTISAQAAPDPALKYHLLPPETDRTPGNAVLMYYMAMQVMPYAQDAERAEKQRNQIDKYLEMPMSELPQKEVAELIDVYSTSLRQIEIGAVRENADWGLPFSEGISMLMPSLGSLRNMGKVLALKARLEIAQGRFDQAAHTIQIGLAMGRHVGEKTVLIGSLVGISIDAMMLERVQELIERGGPNMYWALAELKAPLVDVRWSLNYERQWMALANPEFRKAAAGHIGPAEGAAMLKAMIQWAEMSSIGASPIDPGAFNDNLRLMALAAMHYEIGMKTLIERGRSREEVEAMTASQVVAIYLWDDYAHWRDELFKWFSLPYPEARDGLERSQKEFKKWAAGGGKYNPLISLLPGLVKSYFLQTKLDRTLAALQTIESIRVHAARHGGPPATLDKMELPSPPDPITGKPFEYIAQGETFTLACPAPKGVPDTEGVRYEVRVTPAKAPASAPGKASAPASLPAEGPWEGIEKFIRNDTLAIIQIDLPAITSDAAWQQFTSVMKEANLSEGVPTFAMAREMGQQHVKAGASEAFVLVNALDMPGLPMIVIPLGKGADAEKLAAMLPVPSNISRVRRVDGALVVAAEKQFLMLAEARPAKAPTLMKAMASTKGAVRVAFAIPDGIRRVVDEILATLPPELGNMPGTVITRGLQWASLDIAVQPEISLRLVVQSADAESAKAFENLMRLGAEVIAKEAKGRTPEDAMFQALLALGLPQPKGDQLALDVNRTKLASLIRDHVGPLVRKGRAEARRVPSMINLSNIGKRVAIYMGTNKNQAPPDFAALIKDGMDPGFCISPKSGKVPPKVEKGVVVGAFEPDYVYLKYPNISDADAGLILAYEKPELNNNEGTNVLYVDTHVGWVDMAGFEKLLKKSQDAIVEQEKAEKPRQPAAAPL